MLFDEENNIEVDRLTISENVTLDTFNAYSLLESSLNQFNNAFYENSSELLLRETFSKAYDSMNGFMFMNESIDDFIIKTKNDTVELFGSLDNVFNQMIKIINTNIMKDQKFISTYKDEFMLVENRYVAIYNYNTQNIPNINILKDIIDVKFDIRKLDISNVKAFKKNESYYNMIRGKILNHSSLPIGASKFRTECIRLLHGSLSKPVRQELNPKLKMTIIDSLENTPLEIKGIEEEKNRIRSYTNMCLMNIVNQFNYIKKYDDLDKYQYDAYTTFIYEKVDELRNVLKYIYAAFSLKMDVITERFKVYMDIFKETVLRKNIIKEDVELDKDVLNLEEYQLNEDETLFAESMFLVETNMMYADILNTMYNEDSTLIQEGVMDFLENLADKLKSMLTGLFDRFMAISPKKFSTKYPKESKGAFLVLVTEVDFKYSCFYYDINKMIKSLSQIKVVNQIQNIESEMQNVNAFRKKYFNVLYADFKGSTDKEWKTHIKNSFRGKKLENGKEIIERAYDYCNENTYQANKKNLTKAMQHLVNSCNEMNKAIKEAKLNTTAKDTKPNDRKLGESSFIYSEEVKDNKAELDAENKRNDAKNQVSQEKQASQNVDKNDYSDHTDNNKGVGKVKAIQKYITECQTVQGYAWSIFEEGIRTLSAYLSKLNMYDKGVKAKEKVEKTLKKEDNGDEKTVKEKIKAKINKVKEKAKQKKLDKEAAKAASEATAKKSESFDILTKSLNMNELVNKVSIINEDITPLALIATLDEIMIDNNLQESMLINLSNPSSNMKEKYTNLFSSKLNPYLKNEDSILYEISNYFTEDEY